MPKNWVTWVLLTTITLVIYGSSLQYGFSQDDWYFLSISKAHSLSDFLRFFAPWAQSGFAFFRPLGTQVYYFLFSLLGLSLAPVFMHLFMLFIQIINAYFVHKLIKALTADPVLSFLVSLLYAGAAAHFLSLFYIAATQQLLAALFSLVSLNYFVQKKYRSAAFLFLFALLCKETAVTTPLIAFLLFQFEKPLVFNFRKLVTAFLPYSLVGIFYILLRLSGGLNVQSEYHLAFGPNVISSLRWYFLFSYGAPEELIRYGLPQMLINYWGFFRAFGLPGIVTALLPTLLGFFVLIRAALGLLNLGGLSLWRVMVYIQWWLIGLLPVIFLLDHRYPHYLDLALIPMLTLALSGLKPKIQYLLTFILLLISLTTVRLSEETHWTTERSLISRRTIDYFGDHQACQASALIFGGESPFPRELSYALSLENGPRVICQNPSLPVYYEGVSTGEKPLGLYLPVTASLIKGN